MILPTDILEEIKKNSVDTEYKTGSFGLSRRGKIVKPEQFDKLAYDIYAKVAETIIENSELKAKVKTYEAIIENSNFKVAVERRKK